MGVTIRQAGEADINAVILLMEEHALYEKTRFDPTSLAPRLVAAMQGRAPRLTIFIAQVKHKAIGYCSVTQEFSSWQGQEYLHMDCLFIKSQMRGLRIGESLFETTVVHAKKIGLGELQWQTPEWNDSAVRFYRRIGATDKRKRRFQYQVV